jgi:ABC-type transporter Mla maintaining outer membrane lipid asymmetry ATPase subunit MlaF
MLAFKHLSVSASDTHILTAVTGFVLKGGITAVLGPSSAGKLSLLACMLLHNYCQLIALLLSNTPACDVTALQCLHVLHLTGLCLVCTTCLMIQFVLAVCHVPACRQVCADASTVWTCSWFEVHW